MSGIDDIKWLTHEEALALAEQFAQETLGISFREAVDALDRGLHRGTGVEVEARLWQGLVEPEDA